METRNRSSSARIWLAAAVAWGLIFGGVHVAWAAGSRFALVEVAAADKAFQQHWFRIFNLIVATGSFIAAGAAVALARRTSTAARRWVRGVAWLAGGLLLLRGALGAGQLAWGLLGPAGPDQLLAWAPDLYMFVGGVVFLMVALQDARLSGSRRSAGA